MAYYLSQFVGDGSLDPFGPPTDSSNSIFDFRGDSTVQSGRCLLWTPTDLPPDNRYEKVADATIESIPRSISRRIENVLGVTLDQFDTLQAIIAELLILHGSFTDPGRWNPLQANRFGRHVIHLGGKVYDAPAPVGTTITESFNTADSDTLGPDLTWNEVSGDVDIVSNQAEAQGTTEVAARAESDLSGSDHYAQATVNNPDANAGHGLMVRFSASALTAYVCWSRDSTLNNQRLGKIVSGSKTSLALDNSGRISGGEVMKLEIDGSNLTKFLDTVQTHQTTDTSITGNTRTGLWVEGGLGTIAGRQWDDFEAGDLFAGLYVSVDDDPASPTDTDWINNGVPV